MSFIDIQKGKRVTKIIQLSATNTAQSVQIEGQDCTVVAYTGNLYIDPLTTATTATSIKVPTLPYHAGYTLNVKGSLSYISDTTATGQIIVYED